VVSASSSFSINPSEPGGTGTPAFFGEVAAGGLIFEGIHRPGIGSDKADVAAFAYVGKMGILGQKSIAGMNGVNVGNFSGADDAVNPQITLVAGGFADADSLVRELDVHRVSIRVRINSHGADIQLFAGADDANSYLASVCNQDFLKHE